MNEEFNINEHLEKVNREGTIKEQKETNNKLPIGKVKNHLFIGLIIFLLIISIVSAYNFTKVYKGEWLCIGKKCETYITGDEWVAEKCRPQNNTLFCDVLLKNGISIKVPIDELNISQMKSCDEYICVTEVYVRASDEIRRDN